MTELATRTSPIARNGPMSVKILAGPNGGEDQSGLVRMTSKGVVEAVRCNVHLDESLGHITKIQGKPTISAVGYNYLNQFSGVVLIAPQIIQLGDGKEIGNPFAIEDDRGEIVGYRIRKIGIGRNPSGTTVCFDVTVHYDTRILLAQDILKKWAGAKAEERRPRDWGRMYNPDGLPEEVRKHPDKVCLPMPTRTGVLVVDTNASEYIAAIQEHTHKHRHLLALVTTFVERNILKKFFAANKPDRHGRVQVTAWRSADIDFDDVLRLAAQSSKGIIDVDGTAVRLESETVDSVSAEDVDATVHGDVPDDGAEPIDAGDVQPDPSACESLRGECRQTIERLRPESLLAVGLPSRETLLSKLPERDELALRDLIPFLEEAILQQTNTDNQAKVSTPAPAKSKKGDQLFDASPNQHSVENR